MQCNGCHENLSYRNVDSISGLQVFAKTIYYKKYFYCIGHLCSCKTLLILKELRCYGLYNIQCLNIYDNTLTPLNDKQVSST